MDPVRVRALVEGRVQGVYFRESARRRADELGVMGWVRNLPDGRVEAVFEGPPEAVASAVSWMHTGPERAIVAEVETFTERPEGLRGFMIRY